MKKPLISFVAALALTVPLLAQEEPKGEPSPNEIVAAAPASDWVAIPAEDLLVMTLAPDPQGNERKVVIQLMPAPFSQGWVDNIRLFARSGWYDGISVNRVQDNYVVQWGDPNYDNPEATGTPNPLPEGLKVMGEDDYVQPFSSDMLDHIWSHRGRQAARQELTPVTRSPDDWTGFDDPYANAFSFADGFPVAMTISWKDEVPQRLNTITNRTEPDRSMFVSPDKIWPTHCYGMVGVGRSYSPDTGSGAELYTVIGHAPRHLDRNIALVGRVIEGMEHLSSLPRGKGELGFYAEDEFDQRTPILTVRVASDLPEADPASSSKAVGQQTRPKFEYLSTESESFAQYAEARANRRDPFFIVPAGGADICNIPVPVRRAAGE